MKRFAPALMAVVAAISGIAGSLCTLAILGNSQPSTMQAQEPEKDDSIRVALVNLEEVARQSKDFARLKIKWAAAQEDIREQNKELAREYEAAKASLARTELEEADEEETLILRVEIKAIEEQQKVMHEEQKAYLSGMLDYYQTAVLEKVWKIVQSYASAQGYDLVLQDYSVDSPDAAFLEGSTFAQALLAKPVVDAPGVTGNSNAYVTDITEEVIAAINDD